MKDVEVHGRSTHHTNQPHLTRAAVLLQAMKEDPPLDARCHDKFLIQSVSIGSDEDIQNIAKLVRLNLPWRSTLTLSSGRMVKRSLRMPSGNERFESHFYLHMIQWEHHNRTMSTDR